MAVRQPFRNARQRDTLPGMNRFPAFWSADRKPRWRVLPWLIVPLLLWLAGCTVYQNPSLEVHGLTVRERTDEGIALDVAISLHNPNSEPLTLLRFEYGLHVDGQRVFTGLRSAESTLSGGGTHEMAIPVVVPYARVAWSEDALPEQFTYQLHGTLRYVTPEQFAGLLLDLGVHRPTVSFSSEGEVVIHQPAR